MKATSILIHLSRRFGLIFSIIMITASLSCMFFELDFDPNQYSGTPPDLGAPFVSTIIPADGKIINRSLSEIEINFSEEISQATNIDFYRLTGPGVNSLAIESIETISLKQFILHLSGFPGTGEIVLELTSNLMDVSGNQLTGLKVFRYISDGLNPEIETIYPPRGSSIGRNFNRFTITYTEAVSNATNSANYNFTGPGRGTLSVSGINYDTGNSYIINVAGMADNGDFSLDIDGIKDIAGNEINVENINFYGDVDFLTIQNISIPEGSFINNSLKLITVTYSKTITNGDILSNYSLTGSGVGTLAIDFINDIGGNKYLLNLTGFPNLGDIILQFSNSLVDNAGNFLTGQSSFTFQGEGIKPEIIALDPPQNSKIDETFSFIDITFSETMVETDILTNYSFSGPGSGTLEVTSIEDLGGNQYKLNLSGTSVNGRVVLNLDLTDIAGNPLDDNTVEYLRDLDPPQVDEIVPSDGSNIKPGDFLPSLILNISFDDYIIQSSAENRSNYVLSGAGLGTVRIVTIINSEAGDTQFIDLVLMGVPNINKDIVLTLSNLEDRDGNKMPTTAITYHVIPD